MKENKRINLEEATIKALYDDLNNDADEVQGIVDDILVVTDPEITSDEYDEVIEKAQEIIEDTPEGEIPFNEDYIGEYAQTCPICGSTFIEKDILEPGATCPICLEQPEAFIMVGKIEGNDNEEDDTSDFENYINGSNEDNNLDNNNSNENEDEDEDNKEKDTASKHLSGNKLQEGKASDRINQLMDIIDNSFEVKLESKNEVCEEDKLEEDKLEEDIRLTSIPGVTRTPETDFSDDRNRFKTYLYRGVVPISYLKDKYVGDIYLTIAFHHLDDINYEEYSKFKSYKLGDEFNGVSESTYDAEKFKANLDAAYNDIMEFRNNVQPIDNDALEERIKIINEASKEYKQKVEDYIKEHATEIINLDEYDFKHLKEYIKEAGERTADYIREASESSKRDFLQKDIESLKRNISNSWQFKWIEEMFNKNKNESKNPRLNESISGMDIFEDQDADPEINLDLYGSDAQEALIFIENNINKLNADQLHELADHVFMEDISNVREFMKYLISSDDEDIIEISKELKKYIPESKEVKKEYIEHGFSSDPLEKHEFDDPIDIEQYIQSQGYELLNDDFIDPTASQIEIFDPTGFEGEVYVYDIEEGPEGWTLTFKSKDSYNLNESKLNESLSKECKLVIRDAIAYEKEYGTGNCDEGLLKVIFEDLDNYGFTYNKEEVEDYFFELCEYSLYDLAEEEQYLKENKSKIQETGEWDDSDDEMSAWLEDMKIQAKELADEVKGIVKTVKGFDKYQGPFAVINTPKHGDIKLWYDSEDDTGRSFIAEIAHEGSISGGIQDLAKLLNEDTIDEKYKLSETKACQWSEEDKKKFKNIQ